MALLCFTWQLFILLISTRVCLSHLATRASPDTEWLMTPSSDSRVRHNPLVSLSYQGVCGYFDKHYNITQQLFPPDCSYISLCKCLPKACRPTTWNSLRLCKPGSSLMPQNAVGEAVWMVDLRGFVKVMLSSRIEYFMWNHQNSSHLKHRFSFNLLKCTRLLGHRTKHHFCLS